MNLLAGLCLSILLAQPATTPEARVESILRGMSLEQKVGQLMMVGFGGKEMGPKIHHLMQSMHIGAAAIYSRNVRSLPQVAKLIRDLRKGFAGQVQPFIAVDQEGGNVVRMRSGVAVLPGAMTLGAARDPVLSYLAAQAHAVDLKLVGFDMNLAPVLDTNRNPKNPVINVRAFGDSPELVADMGVAFCLGQQDAQLATVAKHFPGHGTTAHDSHFDLPTISLDEKQLTATELKPFCRAINAGLDALMTAHVQIPAIDPSGTPASLSHRIITGLLREKLGFDGVVITDDLEMRAVSGRMGVGKAAVKAVLAGADMVMVIWTSKRKKEVFRTLLAATQDGTIPLARLDQSVRRILLLKARRGTLDSLGELKKRPGKILPNRRHQHIIRSIAARGLTLVHNNKAILPICSGKGLLVAAPQRTFRRELQRLLPGSRAIPLKLVSSRAQRQKEFERLREMASRYELLVVGVTNVYQAWLVQKLYKSTKIPMVVVSFGSPYLLRYFPKIPVYLCSFSYLAAAQRAAARALVGKQSLTGRLPVRLSKRHPRGSGLTLRRGGCRKRPSTKRRTKALRGKAR